MLTEVLVVSVSPRKTTSKSISIMDTAQSALIDPTNQLDTMAKRIAELGLAEPTQFFLAAHLPLLTLGRHLGLLFQPLLSPIVGHARIESFLSVLEDPQKAELLLARLEHYSTVRTSK